MIPINNGTIDYVSFVTREIDRLVTSGSPVFLTEGNRLLTSIGVIMLVIFSIRALTAAVSHHHSHFDLPGLVHFFALFLITEALLRYYNAPLPWGGSSVSSILPDTATQYSAWIDLSALNTLLAAISDILKQAEQPGAWNVFLTGIYYMMLGLMVVVQGVLFAVTIMGFVAVGIGTVVGPVCIPWLIVPRMSWLFWNWLSYMMQYSFYKVVASALMFVWSNVMVNFLNAQVAGDYTMAHFLLLLAPLAMLTIGMAYSVFKVTVFANDLFKGGASAGAAMGDKVGGAVRKAFNA